MLHLAPYSYLFALTNHKLSELPSRRRITNRKVQLVRRYQHQRSHNISIMSDPKKLICLISRGCHDRTQSTNQSKALDWLSTRGVPHTIVDGNDIDQRDERNRLFEVSGIRGNYPQFFFEWKDGTINFFGNFDKIDVLNETTGLSPEILALHPEFETWDKVFGSVVESF